jgi:hypothetical protein
MAEIDIQPKKRPIWPWILGIIAAIIIIWIIVKALDHNNANDNNNANTNDTTGNVYNSPKTPTSYETVYISNFS